MNKLFKPKCINRIVVFLALLAPIIYLFGTMGTYLMGAHGSLVLAQHEQSINPYVLHDGVPYERVSLATEELSFVYSNGQESNPYCSFVYPNIVSLDEGYSNFDNVVGLDVVDDSGEDVYPFNSIRLELVCTELGDVSIGSIAVSEEGIDHPICLSLGFWFVNEFDDAKYYVEVFALNSQTVDFVSLVSDQSGLVFHDDDYFWNGGTEAGFSLKVTSCGFLPDNVSLNSQRQIPAFPSFVDSDDYVENSDYLFGQMFPRDNFLSKVGQNALSDNPMGFAPFGWLLSYLDRNMLHMGASQLAQMGYGYFYWCAHVLLLDLVFYFAVFFIRFIKHVGDMFIKEE